MAAELYEIMERDDFGSDRQIANFKFNSEDENNYFHDVTRVIFALNYRTVDEAAKHYSRRNLLRLPMILTKIAPLVKRIDIRHEWRDLQVGGDLTLRIINGQLNNGHCIFYPDGYLRKTEEAIDVLNDAADHWNAKGIPLSIDTVYICPATMMWHLPAVLNFLSKISINKLLIHPSGNPTYSPPLHYWHDLGNYIAAGNVKALTVCNRDISSNLRSWFYLAPYLRQPTSQVRYLAIDGTHLAAFDDDHRPYRSALDLTAFGHVLFTMTKAQSHGCMIGLFGVSLTCEGLQKVGHMAQQARCVVLDDVKLHASRTDINVLIYRQNARAIRNLQRALSHSVTNRKDYLGELVTPIGQIDARFDAWGNLIAPDHIDVDNHNDEEVKRALRRLVLDVIVTYMSPRCCSALPNGGRGQIQHSNRQRIFLDGVLRVTEGNLNAFYRLDDNLGFDYHNLDRPIGFGFSCSAIEGHYKYWKEELAPVYWERRYKYWFPAWVPDKIESFASLTMDEAMVSQAMLPSLLHLIYQGNPLLHPTTASNTPKHVFIAMAKEDKTTPRAKKGKAKKGKKRKRTS